MKTSPDFPKTLSKQVKGECILNAVLARKFLFISTNKRLITVDTTRDVKNSQIDSIAHGDWDPSGLTCYESDRRLVVILGQRKLNHRIGYKSRLRIFKNNINSSTRMSAYPPIDLPIHDFPKTLEYDPEEHMITCVTSLQNKVIVWKVNEEFGAVMEPFEHANDEHTAVRDSS